MLRIGGYKFLHIHHTYRQGTHIQTGDTHTDRGRTDRHVTHIQTGDTHTYKGHTDIQGTHIHTRDTQTDCGHTDIQHVCRYKFPARIICRSLDNLVLIICSLMNMFRGV
jgi:hypothetical protein